MFRLFLAFLFIAASSPLCDSRPQSLEGRIQSSSMQVKKNGQPVQLDLQDMQVTMPFADGTSGKAEIILLHEPRSGLFWWTYQALDPTQSSEGVAAFQSTSVICVTEEKIVVFKFRKPFVWVRESTEHYPTIDEGRNSVLATLKKTSKEIETGSVEWFRGTNVAKAVGYDFLHLKGNASPFPGPKLKEVSRKNGQWHLTLDGPNKDSAELVLGEDYQLISAVRLPARGL